MTMNNSSVEEKPKGAFHEGLIFISTPSLLLAMVPLAFIALLCWWMGLLQISSSIVVGCIRTFVQLTMLGSLLRPIFLWGKVWLIVGYASFMILLAAYEASSRTKYVFEGQFYCILGSLFVNVGWVSLFAFGVIIRPRPLWNPRYVIPIVGMLLGNSISGVSLSLDAITRSLVEQQQEIELYLSFGATKYEAIARLLGEAIQTGATPILNSMRVIGIIAIPGMMTGQILGGSPSMVAARYQMLIIYLIAICTLGVILIDSWMAVEAGFDSHQLLRTDRFVKSERMSVTAMLVWAIGSVESWSNVSMLPGRTVGSRPEVQILANKTETRSMIEPETPSSTGSLQIRSLKEACSATATVLLEVQGMGCSFRIQRETSTSELAKQQLVLFQNISLSVNRGDMLLVDGPSGVGKSTLLRMIAGLRPMEEGSIQLAGKSWDGDYAGRSSALWRRQIRYVTQSKVGIPGTPRHFINRVTSFQSWHGEDSISAQAMARATIDHLVKLGLRADCLDKDWSFLSGGEAQRVIVALALASKPKIVLFDESTSALDRKSKMAVEQSVKKFVHEYAGGVVWISHDEQQAQRMSSQDVAN